MDENRHRRHHHHHPTSDVCCFFWSDIPTPIPRASNASRAALAAPSDPFFVLVRVLRRAPNACALITANVPHIGGVPGEGDREVLDVAVLLRTGGCDP